MSSRIMLASCALFLEAAHLGWEHTHGGVRAHHLLANPDLPAISNWWGLLVVPLLVWFLLGRIERRLGTQADDGGRAGLRAALRLRFCAALLWGAALAAAFTFGHPAVNWIFAGAFILGLVLHVYRAEYVLGFVLGMTFTFGAVLPVLVACAIAAWSFLVHLVAGAVLRLASTSAGTGGRTPG